MKVAEPLRGSSAPRYGSPFRANRGEVRKSAERTSESLAKTAEFGEIPRPVMANRAIWSMRKRHEWLATPLKKRRVKRATRVRCGLQEAIDRKGTPEAK